MALDPGGPPRSQRCPQPTTTAAAPLAHSGAQVFAVNMDARRSRRFPVSVPLHNLRAILGVADVEGLAEAVSNQLQAGLTVGIPLPPHPTHPAPPC
jgi:hypothetical protein